MARCVPRRSETSEAIASSVIEFSHTLETFRAGLRRSVAFGEFEDKWGV